MAASDLYGQPKADFLRFLLSSGPANFLSDYLRRNGQAILDLEAFNFAMAHIVAEANQRLPSRVKTERPGVGTSARIAVIGLRLSDRAACGFHRIRLHCP